MKIFGLELKFNGFDIWHKGNFNPDDKSSVGHKHIKSDITDFPSSMPANGGNSDTVGNISPSKFVRNDIPSGTTQKVSTIGAGYDNEIWGLSQGGRLWINYRGYDETLNNNMETVIGDGKGHAVIDIIGTTKTATLNGKVIATTDQIPSSLPANGGTANKATITHRLYRHDPESEDSYYISPWWTGNTNGWRIGAYNTNGDEQSNIHRVSVDKADYADSAGNSDTVDGKHASDFAPNGYGLGTMAIDISNKDLNNYITTGFFRGYSMSNAPSSNWFYIEVIGHDPSWTLQIANDFFNNLMYYRRKNNGTWQSWIRLASTSDIPVKLSQLQNDIGAGGGVKITTSSTAPSNPSPGDFWYKTV